DLGTILIYQGALTLLATLAQGVMTPDVTREFTATGGLLVLGVGITLLRLRPVRVGNLLPALLVVVALNVLLPVLSSLIRSLGIVRWTVPSIPQSTIRNPKFRGSSRAKDNIPYSWKDEPSSALSPLVGGARCCFATAGMPGSNCRRRFASIRTAGPTSSRSLVVASSSGMRWPWRCVRRWMWSSRASSGLRGSLSWPSAPSLTTEPCTWTRSW